MRLLVAALLLCLVAGPAQASRHGKIVSFADDPHARTMPVYAPLEVARRPMRLKRPAPRKTVSKTVSKTAPQAAAAMPWGGTLRGYGEHIARGSVSLAGVVPELAHFARNVMADCGSRVISALRNTRVRGSGTISLHASGRAVDIAGNPACIARHLAHWRGGASNDYHRISPPHYHVSWGGREHGRRFAHYTGRKAKRVRTARVW